ncbi:hypothetical protein [Micromonospora echinofusca]|uniref:Uncharacterized protein n=1 Tax=Micromonospora echinofusca TaxID=47858 RepID=A0ABS3VML9_MICEH|nr:hypothetical protein [Micromonospora echinofusca]MBO4205778.1 hypothetical protein [Micromonospora echinofusca]
MGITGFLRFGAGCAVVLGTSIAVPGLIEIGTGETAATSLVLALGVAFGAPAIAALHLRQRETSGRLGAVAFAVNVIGMGLFAAVAFALNTVLFHLPADVAREVQTGPTRPVFLGSALVFVVGSILFGVAMWRAGVFPRVAAAVYAVAVPSLALLAPLPDSPLTGLLHGVAGGVMVWLGAVLWRQPSHRYRHGGPALAR